MSAKWEMRWFVCLFAIILVRLSVALNLVDQDIKFLAHNFY